MATQVPSQSTSTSSQTQTQYESCLLVSRHQLLPSQQADLEKICEKIERTDMLPTNPSELKTAVSRFDAIVGIVPLPLQVQLLQFGKAVLLFYMEALGTTATKSEAEELLRKSGLEGVILPPARDGEPYRVTVYKGIILVKEIKVVDEYLIRHG